MEKYAMLILCEDEPLSDEVLEAWLKWGRKQCCGRTAGTFANIIRLAKIGSQFERDSRTALDKRVAESLRAAADRLDGGK